MSIVVRLAAGLLQLPKLYNAWSVEKDQGAQSILWFTEFALLIIAGVEIKVFEEGLHREN